jgi:hypothetical protein
MGALRSAALTLALMVSATNSAAQPAKVEAFLILCIDEYGQNRDTWQIDTTAKTVTLFVSGLY